MTTIQKQCLLRYLGHYEGAVDGIWGPASRGATERFQRAAGLEEDGVFGPETEKAIREALFREEGDVWSGLRFFTREEFACRCGRCGGFPAEMEEALLRKAEQLRAHFAAPVRVTSGVRCQSHNAAVGGVANSRHLTGKAMDFSVDGQTAEAVLAWLSGQDGIRYAYAIDSRHVHMDVA